MKSKYLLSLGLLLLLSHWSTAQKKSELFAKIDTLENRIKIFQDSTAQLQRQLKVTESEMEIARAQNEDLKAANTTLLNNIKNFSTISKQNSETVNKALASLNEKQQQTAFLTQLFSAQDSITIGLISEAKKVLGESTDISFSGNELVIYKPLNNLFDTDTSLSISTYGQVFLDQFIIFYQSNNSHELELVGLNITGEFGTTYSQLISLAQGLKARGISPAKINVTAKDGNFKEGFMFVLRPNYRKQLLEIKKTVKP